MKTNHCGRNYTESGATFTLRCTSEFQCPECKDKDKLIDKLGEAGGEIMVKEFNKQMADLPGVKYTESDPEPSRMVEGQVREPVTLKYSNTEFQKELDGRLKKLGLADACREPEPMTATRLNEMNEESRAQSKACFDKTTENFQKKILDQLDEEKRSGRHDDMVFAMGITAERFKESKIQAERAKKYGDFKINMLALTKVIEAMASQSLQQEVKLPDNFGALLMCEVKVLRECFMSDPDNGLDHYNYLRIARELGERRSS